MRRVHRAFSGCVGLALLTTFLASARAADIMSGADTCYAVSFPRDEGPIKELTAIYHTVQGANPTDTPGVNLVIQFTEWDVPNQTFDTGDGCQQLGQTFRCQLSCDGGHAQISLLDSGQLMLETEYMRTNVAGDKTLLEVDEADGGELAGLFSLPPRGKDAACQPLMTETFVLLQAGDITNRVKDVEQRLNTLGQLLELPDEVFDEATKKAVTQFQRQYGLPSTGMVDERTSLLLAALVRRGAGGC